ncbi:MAG: flavodoxin family protein [Candidatus Krumholzibacteriota bacterium]|nr:flavodoxin family protein [Candidatus Krumholzibacteriota bacterium]
MLDVVAINGSPRAERSQTAQVLAPFIAGMTEAGAGVELLYASRLKVKECTCGTMHCWYGKPGECCVRDDMQSLYPRLAGADLLVLATPVYVPLPGGMQNILNRLCPLMDPRLETREGRTRARFREHVRIRRLALVATGGWWEKENMGTVVRIAEELAADVSVAFAGAVLRPHAYLMWSEGELTAEGRTVHEAVRQAGRDLVRTGSMAPENLAAIARPLITQEALLQQYNAMRDAVADR